MKLQRKIVKILQRLNENKEFPTREELEEKIASNLFLRLRYHSLFKKKFKSKVEDALGDSIAPFEKKVKDYDEYFVDYFNPEERTQLKVTRRGRDFIASGGGFEALLRRRSGVMKFILKAIVFVVGLVGLSASLFYPLLPDDCTIWNRFVSKTCSKSILTPLEIGKINIDYLDKNLDKISNLDKNSTINLNNIGGLLPRFEIYNPGDSTIVFTLNKVKIITSGGYSEAIIEEYLPEKFGNRAITANGRIELFNFTKVINSITLLERLEQDISTMIIINPDITYFYKSKPYDIKSLNEKIICSNALSQKLLPNFKIACSVQNN